MLESTEIAKFGLTHSRNRFLSGRLAGKITDVTEFEEDSKMPSGIFAQNYLIRLKMPQIEGL
jgi:hypothetical protein